MSGIRSQESSPPATVIPGNPPKESSTRCNRVGSRRVSVPCEHPGAWPTTASTTSTSSPIPRLVAALTFVTGDADLATDAVDEACARAVERLGRGREIDVLEAWIRVVARNVALGRLRRLKSERRARRKLDATARADAAETPERHGGRPRRAGRTADAVAPPARGRRPPLLPRRERRRDRRGARHPRGNRQVGPAPGPRRARRRSSDEPEPKIEGAIMIHDDELDRMWRDGLTTAADGLGNATGVRTRVAARVRHRRHRRRAASAGAIAALTATARRRRRRAALRLRAGATSRRPTRPTRPPRPRSRPSCR